MNAPLRIAVADDHSILLDGLRALLQRQPGLEVAGLYNSGQALLDAMANDLGRIDVVMIDINMPPPSGADLARILRKQHPHTGIIVLSMYDDPAHITGAVEAGALGYLLKNVHDDELLEAVRSVANGKMYLCSEAMRSLEARKNAEGDSEPARLTGREIEILKLIAADHSNLQIAVALFISERTVETHRKNMLRKTGSKSMVGLMRWAMERGVI